MFDEMKENWTGGFLWSKLSVMLTGGDNILQLVCAWKMRQRVYKGKWRGKKKYNHKVKQIFTGISESFEPHLKSPTDDGSPASKPLHYMAELCSALQGSWTPHPLLGRGRDPFPKTVLTFEGSTIPSSSAMINGDNGDSFKGGGKGYAWALRR